MVNIEYTLEGKISVTSGELLIIDPCYLKDFDLKEVNDLEEKLTLRYIEVKLNSQVNFRDQMDLTLENSDQLLAEEKLSQEDTSKYSERFEELKLERDNLNKELEKLSKEQLKFSPPYITMFNNYNIVCNTSGDGYYPVLKIDSGFQILFSYPIKDEELDVSKLKSLGKLLGRSNVSGGSQIITDASLLTISDIDSSLYVKFNLENGLYSCKFSSDKDSLFIQKYRN